jgi:hypothetical protein
MTIEELSNEFDKELEKEFEDKDLQSLKEYAIANGADNEVNACENRACVFAIIKYLRISKQYQEIQNLQKRDQKNKTFQMKR